MMDPNKTLQKLLAMATRCTEGELRISGLVLDLDAWLSKGGALPERWCGAGQDEARGVGAMVRKDTMQALGAALDTACEQLEEAAKLIALSGRLARSRPASFHEDCIRWLREAGFDMVTGDPIKAGEDE